MGLVPRPNSAALCSQHQEPSKSPASVYGSSPTRPWAADTRTMSEKQYPNARLVSQEQLVAEVKGIYAGLAMVEAKCIEVDNAQATLASTSSGTTPKLSNHQWQALITLHRTLLHEHQDFFLASQHPSATPALRRLASKYLMPARMWRHGIHSFLELLRHRLPESLDYMVNFIYLAYSMIQILHETVPAFEDTWIECLGDLGRYRMAIEEIDIRDRDVWAGVARHWYSISNNEAPTTSGLHHNLPILARPSALSQLTHYEKSLCAIDHFRSARESILTLFQPVLFSGHLDENQQCGLPLSEQEFIKLYGILFKDVNVEKFESTFNEYITIMDDLIGKIQNLVEQVNQTDCYGAHCLQPILSNQASIPLNNGYIDSGGIHDSDLTHLPSAISCRFELLMRKLTDFSIRFILAFRRRLERPLTKSCRRRSQTFPGAIATAFAIFPAADARPLNTSRTEYLTGDVEISGFFQFWIDTWGRFKDQNSGPLAMNTLWASFLASLYFLIRFCDKRTWKDTDLLAIANWCLSGPSFFLGMGDWLSDWQLALLWSFNFILSLNLLQQKLSDLPRTQDATKLCIITMGFLSAGILSQCMTPADGRYANHWVLTAMLAPFMTLFFTHSWSVFLGNTGIARGIESGVYNGLSARLWQQIVLVSQRAFFAIAALLVFRSMLA